MSRQLIYTSCRSGLGGTEGDQIYSYTEGLTDDVRDYMVRRSGYVRPDNMVDSSDVDAFPIQFEYYDVNGVRCLDLGSYLYTDYTKTRYGSRIIHHVTAESLEGYPIEYYLNPVFRRCLTDDEIESSTPPDYLPQVNLTLPADRPISVESMETHQTVLDKEYLRKTIYKLLELSGEGRPLVVGFDRFDDVPYYVAAMTMIFPRDIADRLTFSTYLNNTRNCQDCIVCTLNDGTRFDRYADNCITDDSPMSPLADPIFDDYIYSAFTENSDREGFFTFLSDFSVNQLSADIIVAYNAYYVCTYGISPTGDPRISDCIRFMESHPCRNPSDILRFFNKIVESGGCTREYCSRIVALASRIDDDGIRDAIMESAISYDFDTLGSQTSPSEIPAVVSEYEHDLEYITSSGKVGLLCIPQGFAAICLKWARSMDVGAEDVIRFCQDGLSKEDVSFVLSVFGSSSDDEVAALISKRSPLSDTLRKGLFPIVLERKGSVNAALFLEMVDVALDDIDIIREMMDSYSGSPDYEHCLNTVISRYSETNPVVSDAATEHLISSALGRKDYDGALRIIDAFSGDNFDICNRFIEDFDSSLSLSSRATGTTEKILDVLVSDPRFSGHIVPKSRVAIMRYGVEMLQCVSKRDVDLKNLGQDEKRDYLRWVVASTCMSESAPWYRKILDVDPEGVIREVLIEEVRKSVMGKDKGRKIAAILTACVVNGDEKDAGRFMVPLSSFKPKVIREIRGYMVDYGASIACMKLFDHMTGPGDDKKKDKKDNKGDNTGKSGGLLSRLFGSKDKSSEKSREDGTSGPNRSSRER